MPAKPTAYSYIRFSTPEQASGDSFRRQEELAKTFCKRKGWSLSAATFKDLGVSAFKGKNALVGNLGEFLKAVKSGAVKSGSYLLVESLDRISRQGIDEGYEVVKSILKSGVRLVTLMPEREFDETATKSLSKGALEIQLILERAAEESERKSDRVGAAWASKRKAAHATGAVMTGRCPAWLKPTADGTGFAVIRDRAEVVRRVYQLAADGYGIRAIVGELTEVTAEDAERDEWAQRRRRADRRKKKSTKTRSAEPGTLSKKRVKPGVKPFGRTEAWTRAYVSKLLSDRRVLGELRPTAKGKPMGEPLTNYYPAILTEGEWLTARAGLGQRRNRPGRVSAERVNVFAGLLREARGRDAYQMTGRVSANPGRSSRAFQVLVNANSTNGRGKGYSVPYDPFEAAILSALKEIDPAEVLPPADTGGKEERTALEKELAGVEAELAKVAGWLEAKGFSPTLATHLEKLETRKADLTAKLTELKQPNAVPLASAWGNLSSLAGTLASAPDPQDARLRLRSALRRTIESMTLLVVPRGAIRLMAVTVTFIASDTRRNILIVYKPAAKPHGGDPIPARWAVRTIRHPDDGLPFSNYDLRHEHLTTDVDGAAVDGWRETEQFLEAYPTDVIRSVLASGTPMPVAE